MEIVNGYPPNYQKIKDTFNLNDGDKIVFTYGNKLYNPTNGYIADHLLEHEKIHTIQQDNDPDVWWDRYFIDVEFRLDQEIEAYRKQYEFYKTKFSDKNRQAKFLYEIASDLSSSMYGNIVTLSEARKLIQNGKR